MGQDALISLKQLTAFGRFNVILDGVGTFSVPGIDQPKQQRQQIHKKVFIELFVFEQDVFQVCHGHLQHRRGVGDNKRPHGSAKNDDDLRRLPQGEQFAPSHDKTAKDADDHNAETRHSQHHYWITMLVIKTSSSPLICG